MLSRFIVALTTLGLMSVAASWGAPVQAQDVAIDSSNVRIGQREYSPHLTRGFPQRVFGGDSHVHTSYSTDAGMLGNSWGRTRRIVLRAGWWSYPAPG